ncbi:hypothetical protein F5144DRAFT_590076 [Chaetomium tenue]|uniref:Uncharacterized protein n=1 Tax=Chaetomium tenue TaxID=1854479 RepID=A0ACB7PHX3_9PEZI|nr:hypothetical protein F5144DRAFT_590076 [Chaetomium globosum]
MRKHFLFNLACYSAAVVVLSCLPGTWSEPLNTTTEDGPGLSNFGKSARRSLFKRDMASFGCTGEWLTSVNSAVAESLDIINYALSRFQAILANLNSNPVPSIVGMNAGDRTAFQTYEAFFGQTNKNAAAIARLNKLIKSAQSIQTALQNSAGVNVEIWCNDYFLRDVDPWGIDGIVQFGDRRWTVDNPVGEWVALVTCTNSPATSAYTYHPTSPPFNEESVVVLCRNYLPAWSARYSAGDVVGRYHNGVPVATNMYQMDHLWGYLPATLIHEFTHAQSIMGDQRLGNQEVAYQWQFIRQLAQENPDLAVNNSGKFAPIYLNQNDWSTGMGQNLGYFPLGTA